MRLFRIKIDKEKISSIPRDELLFLILSGKLLNDMSILLKTTIVSNKECLNDIELKAQSSQTLLFLTLLSGKLYEGWKLINDVYNKNLALKYNELLDEKRVEVLKKIKRYFSKDNMVKYVRNKISFHYDHMSTDVIDLMIEGDDDDAFTFYTNENQGNCFYYMSEIYQINMLTKWDSDKEPMESCRNYLDDVIAMTRDLTAFLDHLQLIMLKKNYSVEMKEVEIEDPPLITELSLPFFIRT